MANYVKFLRGTPQAYANLAAKGYDDDTLYFISEKDDKDGSLYLGSKLIAGGECEKLSLSDLSGVELGELKNKQILYYDATTEAWINADYKDLIYDFVGATEDSSGVSGFVPAPEQGKTNLFLRSDGKWAEIEVNAPSISYDAESPISISADGVISLAKDDTILGLVDDSLTIVGYNEAEAGTVLAKTANGVEWIIPTDSRVDELAAALEELIGKVGTLEATVGKAAEYDEAGDLVSEASGLFADIEKVEKDIADVSADVDEVSEAVEALDGRIETAEGNISTLDSSIGEIKDDISSINESITSLESTKANAADVYTKEETDLAIDAAVAAADHLKRIIVAGLETIDKDAEDADQYIYMILNTEGTYDEYMVVNGQLEKVGDWKVDLTDYATKHELASVVEDIEEELDKKADIVYYQVKNEETGETTQVPGAFLSPEDKEKLSALVVGEGGNVEISGKVNADNVEGLGTWITENGSTYISGLTENNLGSDVIDKLNYITSVDEKNFSVDNSKLKLVEISKNQVNGLEKDLSDITDSISLVSTNVGNLNNLLNGYTDDNNQAVEGLVSIVSNLSTKVSNLEGDYVSKTVFNTTVGDLNSLITKNKEDIETLTGDVTLIKEHLTWQEIEA